MSGRGAETCLVISGARWTTYRPVASRFIYHHQAAYTVILSSRLYFMTNIIAPRQDRVRRSHAHTHEHSQRDRDRWREKKRRIRKATHTFVNAMLSICHTYIYITYIQTFLPFDALFLNLFSPSPFPQFSLHSELSSQQAMPENRYSRFTQINLKGNLKGNLAPGINIYMPASLSREEFIFVLMGSGEINCKRSAMPFHGEHYEGTRKATK